MNSGPVFNESHPPAPSPSPASEGISMSPPAFQLQSADSEASPSGAAAPTHASSSPPPAFQLKAAPASGAPLQMFKDYGNGGDTDSKKKVHWKSNGTPLRVAEDGSTALARSRRTGTQEMYVDAGRLGGINADLKAVKAPLEFVAKGGGSVEGAPPTNLEKGVRKTLTQVKPVEPADHSKVKEIPDDCGNAARTVTGAIAEGKNLRPKFTGKDGKSKVGSQGNPELMKYEIMLDHFSASIPDSGKILGDITTKISEKESLETKLKDPIKRLTPIVEKFKKLREATKKTLEVINKKAADLIALKGSIAADDPDKAKKEKDIDAELKKLEAKFNAEIAKHNAEEAKIKAEHKQIMDEKVGAKTVEELIKEHADVMAEYTKLRDAIMKPYSDLGKAGQDKFDEKAGINRHVNPEVGEAYTISSGGNPIPNNMTWNFHWGGVVFKAGADNINMENYAGNADSQWRLQMYGTPTAGNGRAGQTFHDQHKDMDQHGDAPTTIGTTKS